MFVELMADLRLTFAEQFLARVQVTAAPPPPVALPVARTYTGPAALEEGELVVRREVAGGMVAPDAAVPRSRPPLGGALAPSQAATLRAAGISPTPRAPAGTGAAAKVGRNDPCPCGSGKKYKKCHGAGA
jgi:preprotein translocase subunit SecA